MAVGRLGAGHAPRRRWRLDRFGQRAPVHRVARPDPGGSGAGERGDDGRERHGAVVLAHDVTDAPPLAHHLQVLGDLLHRADLEERGSGDDLARHSFC